MNPIMMNARAKRFYIFKMLRLRMRQVKRAVTVNQYDSMIGGANTDLVSATVALVERRRW